MAPARSFPSTWTRPSPDPTEALLPAPAPGPTRPRSAVCLLGAFGLALVSAALTGCFASPPQIVSLQPARGSVGVAADAPIAVQFDRSVAIETVAGRFAVKPPIAGCDLNAAFRAATAAGCRIVWQAGNTRFVLEHPGAVLAPDTPYTFTLRGGFSDPAGSVNSIDHRWDVRSAAAPQVRGSDPADGSTAVPIEAPLAISFSEPMDAATTARAIHLDPPAADATIVRNSRDPSRFVLFPGAVLRADTGYALTVDASATDEHGQTLAAPVQARFSTAGLATTTHALILARRPGEAATEVRVAAIAPARPGEAGSPPMLLAAPRCVPTGGCGAAAGGSPLYTYVAAALSPNGQRLAVVEQDRTVAGAAPVIVVLDAARGTVLTSVAGAALPAWSPDGELLAFAQGTAVRLYRPAGGQVSTLPAGDPLVAPPAWSRDGEQLVLDSGGPGIVEHVELADAIVGARYALPGLSGASTAPTISPDGSRLALFVPGETGAGTWLVGLGANATPPRLLDATLTPVGWAGPGTLVAISRSALGVPALVRVSVAGDVQIPVAHAPGAGALSTVVVAPSGRQLAYLARDATGTQQVLVENADGSGAQTITAFAGGLEAAAVSLSG